MTNADGFALTPVRRSRERTGKAVSQRTCSGLHRAHFAFMRAVLQGLDPSDSWRRYLAVADARVDLRLVKATLQWIRDEFAAAARREQRPGVARLVQLDARRTLLDTPAIPSLEEFIETEGLDDFSQDEQIQAFQERYGNVAKQQRRSQRLLERQLSALRWLETLASRQPGLDDPVQQWLHPLLSDKLVAAGLNTLDALLTRIRSQGGRWFQGIRGIGAGKAARIEQWLRMQEVAFNPPQRAHGDQWLKSHGSEQPQRGTRPSGLDMVPLERLTLPPALSGLHGSHRAPRARCRIPAEDDLQALQVWLGPEAEREPLPQRQPTTMPRVRRPLHTRRTYRKEAERLLLWAVLERNKPLSSLTPQDAQDYLSFLADPMPAERWCSSQKHERGSPAWRPFNGPLSPVSVAHAARILRSLFRFLVDQAYVDTPLFDAVDINSVVDQRASQQAKHRQPITKSLPSSTRIATPISPHLAWRWSVCTAALPHLRLRQLCEARLCDLVPQDHADPAVWHLQLPRARGRRAASAIQLPTHVIDLLREQLGIIGQHWRPGVPMHPDWRLFEQNQRGRRPGIKRPPTPRQGIQPGTLRDQLRRWYGHAHAEDGSNPLTDRAHHLQTATIPASALPPQAAPPR